MLIVSHGLEVVKALAEGCVWLDRGIVRMRGAGRRGRGGVHGRGAHRGDERDRTRRRVMRVGRAATRRAQLHRVSKQLRAARACARTEPPVVVFSMGKTGSTAIARAVQDATGDRVFQVFRLEPERLARGRAAVPRRAAASRARRSRRAAPLGVGVPPAAAADRRRAPWTVITTVREPVAQAVSAFFHGSGPARRCSTATERSTRSPTTLRRRAAGSARRCAGSTGSSRPRSASTCSSSRFDPGRRATP